ncbi:hypothetical protein KSP40_PGU000935 [Platanthera guangdongensis]|uniref:Uncharacterized protein n=1 Tax=Platanthera guangdongensis TaxID=2320717 RepID=A0ABR2LZS6_9ASPA
MYAHNDCLTSMMPSCSNSNATPPCTIHHCAPRSLSQRPVLAESCSFLSYWSVHTAGRLSLPLVFLPHGSFALICGLFRKDFAIFGFCGFIPSIDFYSALFTELSHLPSTEFMPVQLPRSYSHQLSPLARTIASCLHCRLLLSPPRTLPSPPAVSSCFDCRPPNDACITLPPFHRGPPQLLLHHRQSFSSTEPHRNRFSFLTAPPTGKLLFQQAPQAFLPIRFLLKHLASTTEVSSSTATRAESSISFLPYVDNASVESTSPLQHCLKSPPPLRFQIFSSWTEPQTSWTEPSGCCELPSASSSFLPAQILRFLHLFLILCLINCSQQCSLSTRGVSYLAAWSLSPPTVRACRGRAKPTVAR